MSAASDAKFVWGGRTMTGWHDCCWMPDSRVWKSSEKNVLQPLRTSLWALIFRPSATIVQSERCDWSSNCGNVLNKDVYGVQIKKKEENWLSLHILFDTFFVVSFIFLNLEFGLKDLIIHIQRALNTFRSLKTNPFFFWNWSKSRWECKAGE